MADWQLSGHRGVVTLARNVSTRYVLVVINMAIGLLVLPYNVQHLGSAAYGLWMLAASISTYFMMLDFGYGTAIVRFVAEFRARRDARALNEVLSTMFYVFAGMGVFAYACAVAIAIALPYVFNLEPGQLQTGRLVFLMIALQVAAGFCFGIYGGVINGFEQYYLNNLVGIVSNIAAAIANVIVLWLGYGLVELVAATTICRLVPMWFYRRNAYKVFPQLQIRRRLFRRDRLRDLTGFSVYVAIVDWATRLTYATDAFYLGIFMNTTAVGVYAIAQRLSEALFNLTYQLHTFLMPAVVHRALDSTTQSQRSLLVKATRFQLAIAMCLCGGVAALADPLIRAWIGPAWEQSVRVTQLLALVVVLRAWIAMPTTVLQGTGHHKYVAVVTSLAAVANLVLSIPLVKIWGLVGVAVGTIIPVLICAAIIFWKACTSVELGTWQGARQIVWPAVWPALAVFALHAWTRDALPPGLLPVLARLTFGGLLYVGLFVLMGVDQEERRWFRAACNGLFGRYRPRVAAGEMVP
jgi:O-antigen/teichoic acid export membrane protein